MTTLLERFVRFGGLWLFVAVLCLPYVAKAVEITDVSTIPTDGVFSADITAAEGTLTLQFSVDTAVTAQVTGAGFKTMTDQVNADAQYAFKINANDFDAVNKAYTLTLKATDENSTASASQSVTVVVDGEAPPAPTGVRALGTDSALIVAWTEVRQNTYDPKYNVASYIVYYLDRDFTAELVTNGVLGSNIDSIKGIIAKPVSFTQGVNLNGLKNGQTYWVTVVAVDPVDHRSGVASEDGGKTPMVVKSEPVKTITLSELAGFTDHCFLATAILGDRSAWPLRTLRGFRDHVLFNMPGGKELVLMYYKLSPHYAAWLYQHPSLRVALTPLIWALAGMIFALPAALLLLLAWRFRRMAGVVILVLLFVVPARAEFRYLGWLEMAPFKPDINVFNNGSRVRYKDLYSSWPGLMTRVGWAWQITRDYGIPALGVTAGFWQKQGHPLKAASGVRANNITSNLTFVPVELEFQYAFQYWDPQYVVPMLGAGLAFWGFDESVEQQHTRAWVSGWYWRGELRFLLDWLDPQLAMDFKQSSGVVNTHLVIGWRDDRISDFGRRSQFNLSYKTITGALLLEF